MPDELSQLRVSSFDNNSALHCLIHTLLRNRDKKALSPEIKQQLIYHFKSYYSLYGNITWPNFCDFIQIQKNPKDRELMLGPVLRELMHTLMLLNNETWQQILYYYFTSELTTHLTDEAEKQGEIEKPLILQSGDLKIEGLIEIINLDGVIKNEEDRDYFDNTPLFSYLYYHPNVIEYWQREGYFDYAERVSSNQESKPLHYTLIYLLYNYFGFSLQPPLLNKPENDTTSAPPKENVLKAFLRDKEILAKKRIKVSLNYLPKKAHYECLLNDEFFVNSHNRHYYDTDDVAGEDNSEFCKFNFQSLDDTEKPYFLKSKMQFVWSYWEITRLALVSEDRRDHQWNQDWQEAWYYSERLKHNWRRLIKGSKRYKNIAEQKARIATKRRKVMKLAKRKAELNLQLHELGKISYYESVKLPYNSESKLKKILWPIFCFIVKKLTLEKVREKLDPKVKKRIELNQALRRIITDIKDEIGENRDLEYFINTSHKREASMVVELEKLSENPYKLPQEKRPEFLPLSRQVSLDIDYCTNLTVQSKCKRLVKLLVKCRNEKDDPLKNETNKAELLNTWHNLIGRSTSEINDFLKLAINYYFEHPIVKNTDAAFKAEIEAQLSELFTINSQNIKQVLFASLRNLTLFFNQLVIAGEHTATQLEHLEQMSQPFITARKSPINVSPVTVTQIRELERAAERIPLQNFG